MTRLALLLCLLVGAAAPSASWAQSADDELADLDRLALAARLIADGYDDRAAAVLAEVDVDDEDLDRARFYTLRGLIGTRQGRHADAVADFRSALKEEGVDPLVNLWLAQSLLSLDDADGAVEALDGAGPAAEAFAGTWLLKSRAQLQRGDQQGAWVALSQGEVRFADDLEFPRQKVFLLVEMGLFQEALEAGRALLARTPEDDKAWIALAQAVRNAGNPEEAVVMLEEARLRFPLTPDVATLLARIYLQLGHPASAGGVLQVAAELDPSLFSAAAESFRQAGDIDRALYLNSRVPDATEKAKQRLGLYIEQQDWARAVALESRLQRLQLLEQDAIRYAVAYAWFQLGDVEQAEAFLKGIQDPRWFRDATTLREAMSRCADQWGCP